MQDYYNKSKTLITTRKKINLAKLNLKNILTLTKVRFTDLTGS